MGPSIASVRALSQQVLLAACPRRAWSVAASMEAVPEEQLLEQPNLAAAASGWSVAVQSVQNAAIASWRRAAVESEVWSALGRLEVAEVVPEASRFDVPLEELSSVRSLLQAAYTKERAVWKDAPPSRYIRQLREDIHEQVVSTLAPHSLSKLSKRVSLAPTPRGRMSPRGSGLSLRLRARYLLAQVVCCEW